MKKFIALLVVVAGIGAGLYFAWPALQTAMNELTQAIKPQDVTQIEPTTTTFGKRSTAKPKTEADITEAIAGEYKKNSDTIAWLTVPGTTINHSVLQTNNNALYLRLNEDKQPDIYGCYFADYENSIGTREEMSPTTVIYGHSDLKDNSDGPRFSQLFKFTDPEFAQKTPTLNFSSMEENMKWEIFAVSYVDVDLPYVETVEQGQELLKLAEDIRSGSLYNYETKVTGDDKIIILSTCTVKFGSSSQHRLLIAAKLMPQDSADITDAKFSINSNLNSLK